VTAKRKKGLLIAEDEDELRILLATVLEAEGFKVFQAEDGQQGIELIKEHMDEIDIVLSDLGLPKVSGLDLIQQARKLKPTLKIIGSSGYGRVNIREEVLNAGGDEFHPKPFVAGELIDAIKKLVGDTGIS
jgi:DNA-binding response OmpR family regulator